MSCKAHFDCGGEKFTGISSRPLVVGEVVPVQSEDLRATIFLRVLSVTPSGVNGDLVARVSRVNTGPAGSMAIAVRPEKGEDENRAS